MKKKIFWLTLMLSIFSSSLFAQLKVDSYGRVGIGSFYTPNSLLAVGHGYAGNGDYTVTIAPPSGKQGVVINNYASSSSTSSSTGMAINNAYDSGKSTYGIKINTCPEYGTTTSFTYSLYANAGGCSSSNPSDPSIANYGVAATLLGIGSAYGAAIIGSTSSIPVLLHPGKYAGYFNGDVRTTGSTYSNLLSPSPVTPTSLTIVLDESRAEESIVNKLTMLKPTQLINNSEPESPTTSEAYRKLAEELGEDVNVEEAPVQTRMSTIRYSIDEASLREACPELVYEDKDGNVSINYIEMVPLLVQSIKELKAEIEELKGNDVKKAASRNTMATSMKGTDAEAYTLYQNEPNPFKEATTVKLTIPKKAQDAALIIYDMSGKQLKQININDRGKTSVKITSEGLGAGMYLYSLIADGKVINTKRMIINQ